MRWLCRALLLPRVPLMRHLPAQFACHDIKQDGGGPVPCETLTQRMAWTLRHSITAVTCTSFTTAAAFGANFISAIAILGGAFLIFGWTELHPPFLTWKNDVI